MRSEDADLVAQMHHSIGQTPAWQGFLQRLALRLGAASASVTIDSPNLHARLQSHAFPPAANDLAANHRQRMRYLRVYSGEDIPHPNPFRALRGRLDGGESAWITVQKEGADFGATASALLTMLAENLVVACQHYIRLCADAAHGQQMQDMAARLQLAWMVVERQGGGLVIVARSGTLPDGMALSGRPNLPADLQHNLITGLAKAAFDPIIGQHLGLHLGLQIMALPCPASPDRAVIYLQNALPPFAASPQLIAALTGLTRAEARFAQKMAQGLSIAEAGAALALTPETARYYSKQVYAKLGLPNQTALVRMLHASVLRLV